MKYRFFKTILKIFYLLKVSVIFEMNLPQYYEKLKFVNDYMVSSLFIIFVIYNFLNQTI